MQGLHARLSCCICLGGREGLGGDAAWRLGGREGSSRSFFFPSLLFWLVVLVARPPTASLCSILISRGSSLLDPALTRTAYERLDSHSFGCYVSEKLPASYYRYQPSTAGASFGGFPPDVAGKAFKMSTLIRSRVRGRRGSHACGGLGGRAGGTGSPPRADLRRRLAEALAWDIT